MGIMNFPFNGSFRLFESEPDFVHVPLPEHVNSQDFERLVAAADPRYCTPTNLLQLERDKDELLSQLKELKDGMAAACSQAAQAGDTDAPMKIKKLEGRIADLQRKHAEDLEGLEAGANFTRIMPPEFHLSLLGHIYTSNVTHMLRIIIPCFQ